MNTYARMTVCLHTKTDESEPHDGSTHAWVRNGRAVTCMVLHVSDDDPMSRGTERTVQIRVEMHMCDYFRPRTGALYLADGLERFSQD